MGTLALISVSKGRSTSMCMTLMGTVVWTSRDPTMAIDRGEVAEFAGTAGEINLLGPGISNISSGLEVKIKRNLLFYAKPLNTVKTRVCSNVKSRQE